MPPLSAPNFDSGAQFQHARLSSPSSIRILTLRPASESDAPLETELTELDLTSISNGDESKFEALSYVWGSRFGTEPLVCDGKQLLVTPNCKSALRHLRHGDAPRTLWVDAICIDQEDAKESVEERNAQVAMMGDIYAKARRTLCWFGPGNHFTDEVMGHLERVGSCPSKRGLNKLLKFDQNLRDKGLLDKESSCLDSIFCNPWHSRIWTVQEVAYSKDPYVVCGKASILWKIYAAAAHFLVFEEFIPHLDTRANQSCVSIDVRNVLRDYIHDSQNDGQIEDEEEEDEGVQKIVTLSSCLSDVNQLQATEPRDKIYGIHSLYTALDITLPPVSYEKSVAQVFEGAAVAMMVWSRTLKVLGDACSNNRNPELPSWVPDWSDGDIKLFTPMTLATDGSKIAAPRAELLSPKPGELHVRGKFVGSVIPWSKSNFIMPAFPTRPKDCTLRVFRDMKDDFVEDVETIRLWMDKIMYFRQLYSIFRSDESFCNGFEPEDAFFDILTQGSHSEPEDLFEIWTGLLKYPDTEYDLTFGEGLFEYWRANDNADDTEWTEELVNCGIVMASLLSKSITFKDQPLELQSEVLELFNHFSGNFGDQAVVLVECSALDSLVLTTTFHAARSGDSVALLEGAEYPVVLRRKSSRWHFVGPAYVTGIMKSEAWLDQHGEVLELEKIVLI